MARARPVVSMVTAAVLTLGGVGLFSASGAAANPTSPSSDTVRTAATTTDRAGSTQPERPQVTPLSAELEERRAAQSEKLYGSPEQRPMNERQTSLISLGDSEISGEGVGTYEPGTDGPDNWCHRSPDAAIHRTGIEADVTYNVACSGASTENIRIGGTQQYADELVQTDALAIKARNTRLKQVVLVAGANDDLQFGPVMTDCVIRWFTLQGECEPKYQPGWQDRVDGLVPKVEQTVRDIRSVMGDAGYAEGDYQLVVLGYPSPIGPDIKDNPNYPGKLPGGCTGYTSDADWARDGAVPAFQKGMRTAAEETGATYLDASRLFHGHEVCMENTWARGLYVDLSHPFPPDENSVRQSFHPNKRGHGAFAECLTQTYRSDSREVACADPAGQAEPTLYELAWDDTFAPLRNAATDSCLDVDGGETAKGTAVRGWSCGEGQRNQGWWHDEASGQLYTELTQDRCVDVPEGAYEAGTALVLWDCLGKENQRFVTEGDTIRPAAASELCLTLAEPEAPVRLQKCDGSEQQRFA
ncbi:ricin-type beta-trefoil lectin domain protein [Streptomyces oceani]|uniref:Ricin B lectin domain-containing protein n=1 Tax=Streptomyces oceani TaxID=1075402 RepID=A0A1E7JX77_9ACTN|nr:ricin-type beta-trefoil lectin domain protein [Streptomyces oceani]OEU96274.1 hypothetical protein AN216_21535 [Streptomyces oceani]